MFRAILLAVTVVLNLVIPLGAVEQAPKILLNFDINKTLIAEDMTTHKTMEYTLSSALAERSIHQWSKEHAPMSYYNYVNSVVAIGNKEKQYDLIGGFIRFLESSDYPDRIHVIKTYQRMMNKMEGRYLVPSFVKLIQKMQEQNIEFRIILRTFGSDIQAGKIIEEINLILNDSRIDYFGHFKNGALTIRGGGQVDRTIEKGEEIYRFFRDVQGHVAIQDNWKTWKEDKERERSGKPFIFDWKDRGVVSLFFDDNINASGSEFNIVHPMKADGSSVPVKDCLNRNVFVADTIRAILDEDYFVDLINHSLSLEGHEMRIKNPRVLGFR